MQRNAQGNLEEVSVIFTMQVEPGAEAVVPGLIGTMQAKGPALPSAQQPPAPCLEQWSADMCQFYSDEKMALQGLQCKVISNSLSSFPPLFFFSFPPSSLFFFPLPSNLMCYCSAPPTPKKCPSRQQDDVSGPLKTIFVK